MPTCFSESSSHQLVLLGADSALPGTWAAHAAHTIAAESGRCARTKARPPVHNTHIACELCPVCLRIHVCVTWWCLPALQHMPANHAGGVMPRKSQGSVQTFHFLMHTQCTAHSDTFRAYAWQNKTPCSVTPNQPVENPMECLTNQTTRGTTHQVAP